MTKITNNFAGRPVKYENTEKINVSFGIPQHFREIYKLFEKLAWDNRSNESFISYCKETEGVDITKLNFKNQKGVRSMYLRWIMSDHVLSNLNLLQKE